MRIFYSVVCSLLVVFSVSGQNAIPNPGFEEWVSGGSIFNPYEEPQSWGTPNPTTNGFGFVTATKTTDPQFVHSGNAALKLRTHHIAIINVYAQGAAVTGEVSIAGIPPIAQVTGGIPFNLRPDAMKAWIKYFPQGADTAQVGMLLSKWNNETGMRDTVGTALLQLSETVQNYTEFEIPLEYILEEDPDTMLLGVICSSFFEPVLGTEMYIDDLSLVYEPSSVADRFGRKLMVYPNPATSRVWFDAPDAIEVRILNSMGQVVLQKNLSSGENHVALDGLSSGLYLFELMDKQGARIGVSRLVVNLIDD